MTSAARDDLILAELKRFHEELRAQRHELTAQRQELGGMKSGIDTLGLRVGTLEAEVRALRDMLVPVVASDRRRIDALEVRVSALEAGKH